MNPALPEIYWEELELKKMLLDFVKTGGRAG